MVYSFIRIAGLLPVTAFLSTYEIDKEIPETDNIFDAIEYCGSNGGQLPIFTSNTEALGFVDYRKLISYRFLRGEIRIRALLGEICFID